MKAAVLRGRVARYPARPIILVTKIQPAPSKGGAEASADKEKELPTISVPGEKQKALLIQGTLVQTAPLWEPAGAKIRCKVIIGPEGKISELETGSQLCEAVQWAGFRYQPTLQRGKPVNVQTEVEVSFEARK